MRVDFKKTLKSLYAPSKKDFSLVEVPAMNFMMIDGAGPPGNDIYGAALAWLYPISYGLKFMSKTALERDYVVPPLEGLWWADDMSAYTENRRDEWHWTLMIMQPDWITREMYGASLEKATKKLGTPPTSLRFERFEEGLSAQILHIGPYTEEGPTLARLTTNSCLRTVLRGTASITRFI